MMRSYVLKLEMYCKLDLTDSDQILRQQFISSGIKQLKALVTIPNFEKGNLMKILQCLLPLPIDSNCVTLTELLVHQSDNEFAAIAAYSLAQIEVSHSFVLSLQIAIYWNGPQAVEYSIQNIIRSSPLNGYNASPAPIYIVRGQSAYGLFNPLKFTLALAIAGASIVTSGDALTLSYKAKLFLGIVICLLTQHDYTIEHVALPLAPSGARVYLCPSLLIRNIG
ncbi:MAG: hypothetical protein EZS28_005663 [Streblomastix strix]|uniref:Uncharacterized protein n=1 Tax=Streblomastix strix TaxID=222440 RepID=A0A5J4WV03_9EUKA|nr:MAG: hypothetical protein EZS28_005663 [Streblomastix strix]